MVLICNHISMSQSDLKLEFKNSLIIAGLVETSKVAHILWSEIQVAIDIWVSRGSYSRKLARSRNTSSSLNAAMQGCE